MVSDFLPFSLESGSVGEASFNDSVGCLHHSNGEALPTERAYRDTCGCQSLNGSRLWMGGGVRDRSVQICFRCHQLWLCRSTMMSVKGVTGVWLRFCQLLMCSFRNRPRRQGRHMGHHERLRRSLYRKAVGFPSLAESRRPSGRHVPLDEPWLIEETVDRHACPARCIVSWSSAKRRRQVIGNPLLVFPGEGNGGDGAFADVPLKYSNQLTL